jgi:hypothetical protein
MTMTSRRDICISRLQFWFLEGISLCSNFVQNCMSKEVDGMECDRGSLQCKAKVLDFIGRIREIRCGLVPLTKSEIAY